MNKGDKVKIIVPGQWQNKTIILEDICNGSSGGQLGFNSINKMKPHFHDDEIFIIDERGKRFISIYEEDIERI